MMASLAPLGMPLVTKVVSGEKADDGLYIPALTQIFSTLDSPGLLCVGDGDVTELNPLPNQILLCLGLSPDIYSGLVENST